MSADKIREKQQEVIFENANKDSFVLNGKTYTYRKITVAQFSQLEDVRTAFLTNTDPTKRKTLFIDIYRKAAEFYLGMTLEEFLAIPWEDMRPVIDGCNYRTINGKPFLSI